MPDEFIWIPDYQAQGSFKSDVTKVKFGDGYVQRQTKGMNPITENWSLSFSVRPDAQVNTIVAFLKARLGVTAFTWTPPGELQAKWTCESWNVTIPAYGVKNISLAFEKVYEP